MLSKCFAHPKLAKLRRALRLDHWQVVGLLEYLWKLTREHASDGAIGKFDNDEIAEHIHCPDHIEPDDLVAALVEAGWLDECPINRLVVHDWADHCPRYIKGGIKTRTKTKGEHAGFAGPDSFPHQNPTPEQLAEL